MTRLTPSTVPASKREQVRRDNHAAVQRKSKARRRDIPSRNEFAQAALFALLLNFWRNSDEPSSRFLRLQVLHILKDSGFDRDAAAERWDQMIDRMDPETRRRLDHKAVGGRLRQAQDKMVAAVCRELGRSYEPSPYDTLLSERQAD